MILKCYKIICEWVLPPHQILTCLNYGINYMQLSRHFKLEEFEKSMTATRKGIENKAGSGEIKNLTDLCYGVLEPVRAKFDKPITTLQDIEAQLYVKLLVLNLLPSILRAKPPTLN